MKTEKKILIERTTENGYVEKEYTLEEAAVVLNKELEDSKTIFIDGTPFFGTELTTDIINTTKKKICVTNKLAGG